jgi:hypothetical protein
MAPSGRSLGPYLRNSSQCIPSPKNCIGCGHRGWVEAANKKVLAGERLKRRVLDCDDAGARPHHGS